MRSHILTLVYDFCVAERLKLRRFLIDRMRCELDLSLDEAEAVVLALKADGWIRMVDISHYDPAVEDVTVEGGVITVDQRSGNTGGGEVVIAECNVVAALQQECPFVPP